MRSGVARHVDVAFMKLCYVDVGPATDVQQIFEAYRAAMARLEKDFPATIFVHMTIPLVSREGGLKALAKQLLGRPLQGTGDNLARESLNALLRAQYGASGLLFDLAQLESTRPDGTRLANAMAGEYTDDGGHLNATGRKHVAKRLLAFLCTIRNQ